MVPNLVPSGAILGSEVSSRSPRRSISCTSYRTATINPNTERIEFIAVEKVSVVEQLLIGAKDFYTGHSLDQLAKAQGVAPLDNSKTLAGGWPEGEDVDEFLEDIDSSRVS